MKKYKLFTLISFMFLCMVGMSLIGIQVAAVDLYPDATVITSGKEYSTTIMNGGDSRTYKLTSSGICELKISCTIQYAYGEIIVVDSQGNAVEATEVKSGSGTAFNYTDRSASGYIDAWWNESTQVYSGTFRYAISSGTYYIRFIREESQRNSGTGTGKINFTASFSSGSKNNTYDEWYEYEDYDDVTIAEGTGMLEYLGKSYEGTSFEEGYGERDYDYYVINSDKSYSVKRNYGMSGASSTSKKLYIRMYEDDNSFNLKSMVGKKVKFKGEIHAVPDGAGEYVYGDDIIIELSEEVVKYIV